jgi:putative tryptophan/tyrosine transport system substrate-binding protein
LRRRDFITILGGASATLPFAAVAQQPGRAYRLGVLLPLTHDAPVNVAFLDEFRRWGFIEGQNLSVEWRAYGEHFDLVSQYAAELVAARVDVILTAGEGPLRALQASTKSIPIVALTDDMLGLGFVNSVARPDGNITGVNLVLRELEGKKQEILIEAVPGLRRMGILTEPNYAIAAKLDKLQEAARAQGIEFSIHVVTRTEEIPAAIDSAKASGVGALIISGSEFFYAPRHLIMDRVAALRLPAIFMLPDDAEEGGFAAYGPRLGPAFLGVMPQQIIKLFRGNQVADIPIEQPTKFELVINLKTAKAMGVAVPESLLVRADKVIE